MAGRRTSPDVLVWLAPERDAASLNELANVAAVTAVIPSRGVYAVSPTLSSSDPKAIERASHSLQKQLDKLSGVRWAVAAPDLEVSDSRFHAWPTGMPNLAARSELQGQAALADFRLDDIHGVVTGRDAVVAVLDTGVDPKHELLRDHIIAGYDMIEDDGDPSDSRNDLDDDLDGVTDRAYGHGTFVAGLIHQMAPDAQIVPIRVLDDEGNGSLAAIVEGINYAVEAGATVINLSLGVAGKVAFPPFREALRNAKRAGITVVGAAGNMGERREYFPAEASDVVSVTALAGDRQLAGFANRGKWVDVAAPGVDIVSSSPGDGYVSWGGSSASAAIVSGELALLAQLLETHDPKTIVAALWKSCSRGLQGQTTHGAVDLVRAVLGT